jgi:hypothetical protein
MISNFATFFAQATSFGGSALAQQTTPTTTAATPGYFACTAILTERNKLFFTAAFAGTANRSNELGLAYAQMLREKGYASASLYAPAGTPPPALNVDCRWHATEALATQYKDSVVAGATGNRMTTLQTTFDPQ